MFSNVLNVFDNVFINNKQRTKYLIEYQLLLIYSFNML